MIIDFNRYNGGGSASGVTPEQVQQEIQSALTPYWESGETKDYVDEAVSGLATEQYVQDALSGIDLSNYYTSAQTDTAIANAVSGLATEQYVQDALSGVDLTNYWDSAATEEAISAATSGKADAQNVESPGQNWWLPGWNNQGVITGTTTRLYQTTFSVNGIQNKKMMNTNGASFPNIYAPITSGNAGDILVSTGNGVPVWSSVTMPDMAAYYTSAQTEDAISAATADFITSGNAATALNGYSKLTTDNDQGVLRFFRLYQNGSSTATVIGNPSINGEKMMDNSMGKNFVLPTSADVKTQIEDYNYVTSAQVETQIVEKNYVTSAQVETQITGKNYITSADTADMVTSTSVSTIWRGTQVQYDAIAVKDPNTFYIILLN